MHLVDHLRHYFKHVILYQCASLFIVLLDELFNFYPKKKKKPIVN